MSFLFRIIKHARPKGKKRAFFEQSPFCSRESRAFSRAGSVVFFVCGERGGKKRDGVNEKRKIGKSVKKKRLKPPDLSRAVCLKKNAERICPAAHIKNILLNGGRFPPIVVLVLELANRGHRVEYELACTSEEKARANHSVGEFAGRPQQDFAVLAALFSHLD